MTRLARGLALAAAVFGGGLLAAAPVRAADGTLKVDDEAGLFSADGVAKAKAAFEGAAFKAKTTLTVHTVKAIPAGKTAEFDAAKKDPNSRAKFFDDWARELARKEGKRADVYVLAYHAGGAYIARAVTDREADVHRHFSDAQAGKLAKTIQDAMKSVHDRKLTGADANKEMDPALLAAATYVADEIKDSAGAPAAGRKAGNNAVAGDVAGGKGSGIMGYVCIGLCVLLGVWLVVGLIRAFTGGGGGGYGGGGGFGGGGGGFFSSMMGGLFGAAAGMYLYDNFFGGHSSSATDAAAADGGGYADTGDGDYAGGASGGDAGGGDWGDSGGDAGGGDWGGGDAGGGGDWGGGGGDFGGGGDW